MGGGIGSGGSPATASAQPTTPPAKRSAAPSVPPDELPFSGVGGTAIVPKLETPALEPVLTSPTAPSKPETTSASTASLAPELERIREYLESKRKPMLVTALLGAHSIEFNGDELVISFEPEASTMRGLVSKSDSIALLREACQETMGRTPGISIVTAEQDADAPLSRQQEEALEKKRLRAIAEQIPAVQKVLQVFQGEIVDVRPANQ
jgi:hypothetical protein